MNIAKKYIRHIEKSLKPGTSKEEKEIEKQLRKYFKIQRDFYLKELKDNFEIITIFKNEADNLEVAKTELQKFLESIGEILVLKGANNLLSNLNIDQTFGIQDLIAVEYAKQNAGKLISQIDETTEKQINGIITKGLEDGNDYDEISKAIKTRFKNFSKYRTKLIAVNEIGKAYEYGKLEQSKEYIARTGNIMVKKWTTQGDDRVSDGCRDNAREGWIKTDELFNSGNETPTRFPGCRCYCQYKTL